MIVPTIDDLKSHGLLSAEVFDTLSNLVAAKCCFELAMSKLPPRYLDRLRALADRSPVEARDTYLADILTAAPSSAFVDLHSHVTQ